MHHKTKEKYLKAIKDGVTADELRQVMAAEGIDSEAAEGFITENYEPAPGPDAGGDDSSPEPRPSEPGNKPEKVVFDYEKLTGEEFKRYNDHLASLPLNTQKDFLVFKVEPIVTEKYPGLKGTPRELTGVRTIDKPIQKTRITPKVALNLNSQVRNTRRYYLLEQ